MPALPSCEGQRVHACRALPWPPCFFPGNIGSTNLQAHFSDVWGLLTLRFVWLWYFGEAQKTIPQGAATTVFLATTPTERLVNGEFYWFFAPAPAGMQPRTARDGQLARDVWDASERALARFF